MNFGEFQEKKSRGTFDFPIELHHVTKEHPRYQMPFHWHMDYELIRVLKGSLVLSLNEETLNLTENSGIVLVCDGVLHGGMPVDCVYECLDFDLNEFLRGCSAGKKDIDDVQSHRIILDDFFAVDSEEYKTANRLFDTFIEEKKGYEFIIQGLLFELMGQILGNHRYKISDDETYKSLKRIRQLKSSLKIIREEYMNQLTLGNLAEAADMSPKYFCRFFYRCHIRHFAIKHDFTPFLIPFVFSILQTAYGKSQILCQPFRKNLQIRNICLAESWLLLLWAMFLRRTSLNHKSIHLMSLLGVFP